MVQSISSTINGPGRPSAPGGQVGAGDDRAADPLAEQHLALPLSGGTGRRRHIGMKLDARQPGPSP